MGKITFREVHGVVTYDDKETLATIPPNYTWVAAGDGTCRNLSLMCNTANVDFIEIKGMKVVGYYFPEEIVARYCKKHDIADINQLT